MNGTISIIDNPFRVPQCKDPWAGTVIMSGVRRSRCIAPPQAGGERLIGHRPAQPAVAHTFELPIPALRGRQPNFNAYL